ncbi:MULTISPECIES: heavy-metal-associated domain-containing protein [unclassified Virgibacillus]|uniref:heavy-metal-associated domain-containing protein n=1 Tax=unclassified Virgibacillus TaxID=2620237 RepID=UPI0024DE1BC3|nr:heavy-metal-associated domain-containing protein [Virgibacillus sp. LDC-1]
MKTVAFQLETLTCPTCIRKIEKTVEKIDGVTKVNVLFQSSKVKIVFDESKTNAEYLASTLTKLGYPILTTNLL